MNKPALMLLNRNCRRGFWWDHSVVSIYCKIVMFSKSKYSLLRKMINFMIPARVDFTSVLIHSRTEVCFSFSVFIVFVYRIQRSSFPCHIVSSSLTLSPSLWPSVPIRSFKDDEKWHWEAKNKVDLITLYFICADFLVGYSSSFSLRETLEIQDPKSFILDSTSKFFRLLFCFDVYAYSQMHLRSL